MPQNNLFPILLFELSYGENIALSVLINSFLGLSPNRYIAAKRILALFMSKVLKVKEEIFKKVICRAACLSMVLKNYLFGQKTLSHILVRFL